MIFSLNHITFQLLRGGGGNFSKSKDGEIDYRLFHCYNNNNITFKQFVFTIIYGTYAMLKLNIVC